jgi:hypothetical protein
MQANAYANGKVAEAELMAQIAKKSNKFKILVRTELNFQISSMNIKNIKIIDESTLSICSSWRENSQKCFEPLQPFIT